MSQKNFLLMTALLCSAIFTVRAQPATTIQRAVPATTLRAVTTAAQTAAERAAARAAAKATNADSMPPELTNAIHTMSFDRSSESLFDAVKSQQSGGKLSESEKFRLALLLGDWGHIAAALKTLPEEDATKAYARLLDSLTTNSQSAAQFFQQQARSTASSVTYDENGNAIAAAAPQPSQRRGLFLSDDFYAVIDASPGELAATHR